jgi:Tfp pilus assembly protein PilF
VTANRHDRPKAHRLTLKFFGATNPVLGSVHFDSQKSGKFQWRPAVKALAYAIVTHKQAGKSATKHVLGDHPSEQPLTKTLGEALEKKAGGTIAAFIPEEHITEIFRGTFRHKSGQPVTLTIDSSILPPDNITIELDNRPVVGKQLRTLATDIFRQEWSKTGETCELPAAHIFERIFGDFGDAIRLLDHTRIFPAQKKRIEGFYRGRLLDWDIIAADADVLRDQLSELLQKLRQPTTALRLVAITGPGITGKSTLAWRAAFTLQQEGATVLHVRRPSVEELWPFIPEFVARVSGSVYVLVDDPFRDALQALKAQELNLPLTILATSRGAEYKEIGFPEESQFPLKPLSADERLRVLQKLGRDQSDLQAMSAGAGVANNIVDILVLLLGEEADIHSRRIEQIVGALRDPTSPDNTLGRAYEYICFAWQFFVWLPRSLLERLDDRGGFHALNERSTAQDLIESGEDAFRSTYHSVIAAKIAGEYSKFRSPKSVLDEIASKLDQRINNERRFFTVLLARILMADEAAAALLPFSETVIEKVRACAAAANTILSLSHSVRLYNLMGLHDKAQTLVHRTSTLRPTSEIECVKLKLMWDFVGDQQHVFAPISKWVGRTGNRGAALTTYLNLLKHADTPVVRDAIDGQLRLAKERPTGLTARAALLALINARGNNDQRDAAVAQALSWLSRDVDQPFVHEGLLALLKKRSSPELRERVIAMTKKRLDRPPSNKVLWDGLLSLLAGSEWRHKELRDLTERAIANHPDDANILRRAFYAFTSPLDEPQIRSVHSKLRTLVPPDRADFWLADWLHHFGGWKEAVDIYQRLEFSQEIESDKEAYVKFYVGWGDSLLYLNQPANALSRLKKAETASIEKKRKPSVAAILGQAISYWKLDRIRESEGCFWSAINAAERESRRYAVAKNVARVATRFGFFYCSLGKIREARGLFDRALTNDPTYAWNYFGAGCCAVLLNQSDATPLLNRALRERPSKEDWQNPTHWRQAATALLDQAHSAARASKSQALLTAIENLRSMLSE